VLNVPFGVIEIDHLRRTKFVMRAKAGIQSSFSVYPLQAWIPACAGMTIIGPIDKLETRTSACVCSPLAALVLIRHTARLSSLVLNIRDD